MRLLQKISKQKTQGFTLLELLVAIVIFSIGLLGLAGLQTTSLRATQQSYMRTQASIAVNNIADRMRANMAGVNAGNYDALAGLGAANANCLNNNGCTPAEMAGHDDFEWNTYIANTLPSGLGVVTANGDNFIITVMWDDQRRGGLGTGCSGDPTIDLTCFSVEFQP